MPGGQTAGYHGLWTDPLTGLVYARARWYDPSAPGWLSPDPQMDVDSPNLYAFVAWSPQMYGDPEGEIAESGWDVVSLGFGVTSLGYNLWHRNWGAAGWDAFGVAVDTAALLLPGVPGGVGAATKASRAGRVAVRAAQTAVWAGDAGQGIVQSAEAIGHGQYGWGAFYCGMAAFGGVAGARSLTSALDFNLPGPLMTRADAEFIDNSLTPGFSSVARAPGRGAQAAIHERVMGNIARSRAARGTSNFGDHLIREAALGLMEGLTQTTASRAAGDTAWARRLLSRAELDATLANPSRLTAPSFGKVIERGVAQDIQSSAILRRWFRHVGGPGNPDFVGIGPLRGMRFEITTNNPWTLAEHIARPYGRGLNIATYSRPWGFRF